MTGATDMVSSRFRPDNSACGTASELDRTAAIEAHVGCTIRRCTARITSSMFTHIHTRLLYGAADLKCHIMLLGLA